MTLEVCCADLRSARAAVEGGARRVELCQALGTGGLTPSAGMIEAAVGMGIAVHALIRPREGDFVYSQDEADCMARDIAAARRLGASGVVIGALTAEGDIDLPLCQALMDEARGMSVTFHRAFDTCAHPGRALEQIVALGCDRLLTSGRAATAEAGIPALRAMVERARKLSPRFRVMPGAGVSPYNAARIMKETGAVEIHGSLRRQGHTDPEAVRLTLLRISACG